MLTNRVLEADPNHPYGLLAWGRLLQANGEVDAAVDAHEAAVRFAPIDAQVHFALADSLRTRAEKESPFFRAPTWGRARLVAEQGVYLSPDDEEGRQLLAEIIEGQLADAEVTQDGTPMDMLPHDRIRTGSEPTALGRSMWWLGPTLLVLGWLLWSWMSTAFTWFNVIMTAVLLGASLIGFRVWLAPRMAERRRTVDF